MRRHEVGHGEGSLRARFDPAQERHGGRRDIDAGQFPLDPPVRGRFQDGVGTFLADETFNGKPIRVRFTWSKITPASAHWEQAFSPDAGATWETNWVMDFTRLR